jgi:hypothetical protein
MSLNIAGPLKTADSDAEPVRSERGRASGYTRVDAASYLERYLNPPETGIAALVHHLRHRTFEPQSLKQARKAYCKEVLEKFHSLGVKCEFGLLQHKYLVDPLDLFRFSDASTSKIIQALQSGLAGLGNRENVVLQFDGPIENGIPQLTVIVPPYGISFHGGNLTLHKTFEEVNVMQAKRLELLARKLFDDLEDANRIFVHKSDISSRSDVEQLHALLRTFGPNRLLWVTLEEPGKPAGTVDLEKDGLMHGYIDRFANLKTSADYSEAHWLKICCEALRIDEQSRA